ncbi:YraN family protein [candidate division WOR-3 bacterium]|uniref:UPF0102 protein DRP53_07680 n=1 Tax=candidate division WOR-3 bacterium TaxID=2052148 RepID=A0A660SHW5_UNCW3|nr:MAG: YraN family protein [candidate division WOR-3 bacterium]
MSGRDKGIAGEEIAVEYLKRAGFEIVDRNYRTRRGEIDIIARNREGLRFVEVKMRRRGTMVPPQEAIDLRKMRRIIAAAREYLARNHLVGKEFCHFDVIAIDDQDEIEYIPDAFSANI